MNVVIMSVDQSSVYIFVTEKLYVPLLLFYVLLSVNYCTVIVLFTVYRMFFCVLDSSRFIAYSHCFDCVYNNRMKRA